MIWEKKMILMKRRMRFEYFMFHMVQTEKICPAERVGAEIYCYGGTGLRVECYEIFSWKTCELGLLV